MLVLSKIIPFFMMLSSLLVYLFSNIKHIGEGSSSLVFLLITFIISIILISFNYKDYKINFQTSSKILVLFFIYFILSIVIYDLNSLKSHTVGTTGGIILFYLLGIFISINSKIFIINSKKKILYASLFFSLVIASLLFDTTFELLKLLRTDIFLISKFDELYQRPGNFLIIIFLTYSYFISLLINSLFNELKNVTYLIFLLYVFNTFNILLLSQLFGSNHAFVVVLIIFLLTTLFFVTKIITTKITQKEIKNINANYKNNKFEKYVITIILIISFYQTFILFQELFSKISEVGFDKIRILNFGSVSSVSSVSSRIQLLELFNVHFKYSPFFGNFIVDKITTGEGTYIHSFLGSLLTHQGVLGFIIFSCFMYFSFKEYFLEVKQNVEYKFYYLLMMYFCFIFTIAIMFLFFTNITIWFLIGLIFSPIIFKNRKEKLIE